MYLIHKKYFFTIFAIIIVLSITYFDSLEYILSSSSGSIVYIKNSLIQKKDPVNSVPDRSVHEIKYNFLKRYPSVLGCGNSSKFIQPFGINISKNDDYDYSKPAQKETYELRGVRGVVVYFPIEKFKEFILEFKWMYRSWIEMLKHEPNKWRTDLIVFIDMENVNNGHQDFILSQLNCSLLNR